MILYGIRKKIFLFITFPIFLCNIVLADKAVLITAHGTTHSNHINNSACTPHHFNPWEKNVIQAIDQIKKDLTIPIEVAFGMWETQCIDEAISKINSQLNSQGKSLAELSVIPLFISDFSIVLHAQKYIFKVINKNPFQKNLKQIEFNGKIHFQSAINYNSIISQILFKRAENLILLANKRGITETNRLELNLIMHGPEDSSNNHRWLEMGHRYASDLASLGFAEIHVHSLQDDATDPIRNRNSEILRSEIIGAKTRNHFALILPLLVAPTGIEKGIIERIKDLDYFWLGETLLPDSLMYDYLKSKIVL